MLLPFLPFDPIEAPLSYAARLARYHAAKPLLPFLRDMGISPEELASSEPSVLEQLADLSGAKFDDLCWNAPVRRGKRIYDLRGELLTAELLTSPHTAFCPACLIEDDKLGLRRGRWEWVLSVVRTCQKHEIPILRQAFVNWDDKLHDLDQRVPEREEELEALVSKLAHCTASPLQDYVMHRLSGKAGPKWLDEQTLDQAVWGTEHLGVLIAFGPTQLLPKLTVSDRELAGRLDFAFTAGGESAIREALEVQFRRFDDAIGTPGARKIFGCFYNALASSKSMKDPGDIARILRDIIIERIAAYASWWKLTFIAVQHHWVVPISSSALTADRCSSRSPAPCAEQFTLLGI